MSVITTCVGQAKVEGWSSDIINALRNALGVPLVQWAVFTSNFKGWHRVQFSKPFLNRPAVAAVMNAFYFQPPDMREVYANALKDTFIQWAGDWGALNWLRNKFSSIFYWIGRAIGALQNVGVQAIQQKLLNLSGGMGVTPAAVRNVSRFGCEVFAPAGVEVYVIAVERWG